MKRRKHWTYYLYRLQQRLAITRKELRTLWILLVFLLIGVLVKDYQQRQRPFDHAIYAETDSLFLAAIARMHDSTNAPPSLDREEDDTVAGLPGGVESLIASGGKINLNTATQQELESLPRIGPATAARILEHRARYGPFRRIDDLMNVKGIGEKTLERLEGYIMVD